MESNAKIFVAGHKGMVGSAILRELHSKKYFNYITSNIDLRNQGLVQGFFESEKPDYVFLAAARVGGIKANNQRRAEFIYDNLMIESNVIHQSYLSGVKKLLFLGSSCIYPKIATQPIKEEYLMTGELEPTNESYAIAKIAGISLCKSYRHQYGCNFISCMPTNLYGPNDTYNDDKSHVLPALIKRISEARDREDKEVEIWGTGTPLREFLHVDDLSSACILLMNRYSESAPINVGSGEEVTIKELSEIVAESVGYTGKIIFNPTKPDGMARKVLNCYKIHALGWEAKINLKEGLKSVIIDYLNKPVKV